MATALKQNKHCVQHSYVSQRYHRPCCESDAKYCKTVPLSPPISLGSVGIFLAPLNHPRPAASFNACSRYSNLVLNEGLDTIVLPLYRGRRAGVRGRNKKSLTQSVGIRGDCENKSRLSLTAKGSSHPLCPNRIYHVLTKHGNLANSAYKLTTLGTSRARDERPWPGHLLIINNGTASFKPSLFSTRLPSCRRGNADGEPQWNG